VAYLPERQPLLARGSETTFVSRQQIHNKQEQKAAAREQLSKYVPAATDMRTRMNDVVCAVRAEKI
jgi:hypothetical protein